MDPIAYSLRALLSVQQDDLLEDEQQLLPADQESIDAIRRFLDLYTLAMLSLADRRSRELNHKEVTREDMIAARER